VCSTGFAAADEPRLLLASEVTDHTLTRGRILADKGDVGTCSRWLWALFALFAVRVLAQPLALVVESTLIPRFESWHSGLLPYPLLVATQIVILAWMGTTAWRASHGMVEPSRRAGRLLLGCGAVYGGAMLTRLVLGATMLRGERWFASPLPTAFHLVLASYLFVYGLLRYRDD
jgi:hypothetical protein